MRKVFNQYTIKFLELQMVFLAAILFVIYLLFIFSDYGLRKFGLYLPITGIPALLWLQRFMQLVVVFKRGGDPTLLISRDPFLLSCKAFWLIMFLVMMYFNEIF